MLTRAIVGFGGGAAAAATAGPPSNAALTYTSGRLTRADYADGAVLLLTYVGTQLVETFLTTADGAELTATIAYNGDGTVGSVEYAVGP